MVTFKNVKVE